MRALSDVLRRPGVRPGDLDVMSPQAALPNSSENSSTLSSKHLEVIKAAKLKEKLEVTPGALVPEEARGQKQRP